MRSPGDVQFELGAVPRFENLFHFFHGADRRLEHGVYEAIWGDQSGFFENLSGEFESHGFLAQSVEFHGVLYREDDLLGDELYDLKLFVGERLFGEAL